MTTLTHRRSRFTRDKTQTIKLTDRDRLLLYIVFLLRAVTRDFLEQLFFTSIARCNQRLRSLFDAGFLDRYISPYGQVGPVIYALGSVAKSVVRPFADALGVAFSEADFHRQCRKVKGGLLAHTLAIAQVYVAFKIGLPESGLLAMTRFLPEVFVRQEFDIRQTDLPSSGQSAWRQITVAPDGCLILFDRRSSKHHALLLEADRGDTGSQLLSKLYGYSHFLQSSLAKLLVDAATITVA